MKATNILLNLAAILLSVSIATAANTATFSNDANAKCNLLSPSSSSVAESITGGDLKLAKSVSKENTSVNSADKNADVTAESEFNYLRFDVTKYADPEKELNADFDATLNSSGNEFSYLKFDVKKYSGKDNPGSESTDINPATNDDNYSYLKFDVTKYAGRDKRDADETMNP